MKLQCTAAAGAQACEALASPLPYAMRKLILVSLPACICRLLLILVQGRCCILIFLQDAILEDRREGHVPLQQV